MQFQGRVKKVNQNIHSLTIHLSVRGEHITPDLLLELETLGGREAIIHFEPLHDRFVSATNQQVRTIYLFVDEYCKTQGVMKDDAKAELKDLYFRMSGIEVESFGKLDRLTADDIITQLFFIAIADKWLPSAPYTIPVHRDDLILGCYVTRTCACCNQHGEIHHIEAIGMGKDRKTYDDSKHRVICLCRRHHDDAHRMGWLAFEMAYNLKGITLKKEDLLRKIEIKGWRNGVRFLDEVELEEERCLKVKSNRV